MQTELFMIDESDRLQPPALEQVRDYYDRHTTGVMGEDFSSRSQLLDVELTPETAAETGIMLRGLRISYQAQAGSTLTRKRRCHRGPSCRTGPTRRLRYLARAEMRDLRWPSGR